MRQILLPMLLLLFPSISIAAINMVEVIPFLGYQYFPYTPAISCQPGKPQAHAVLQQAEEFWSVMCASTKAGAKPLPNAARKTAELLLDSLLQVPLSEKLGAGTSYLLGRFWLLTGNPAEATTAFMEAMVSDPKAPEYATALAVAFDRHFKVLSADGQRQEMGLQVAHQLSGRLLEIPNASPDDYLMIGRIYYMCEVAPSAEAVLSSGRMQFPQSGKLALAQALVELRLNSPNAALELLKNASGLPADLDPTLRYLVGVAAWMNGKRDVAAQALNDVIKSNPRQNDARRLLKKL